MRYDVFLSAMILEVETALDDEGRIESAAASTIATAICCSKLGSKDRTTTLPYGGHL